MFNAIGEFLEREAGHVAVSLALMLLGGVFYKLSIPQSEDLILVGLGYFGRSMVGSKSKQQ
jgi:hypothetical protein